ncbi:MAG: MFS transporter [Chloroflexi bacterium]|nr:MFS transporter [Chloroflexota bacterium]
MFDPTRFRHYPILVAFVAFCSFALTIGITQYSFGVFVTELEGEFGWTRSEVSVAMSFFAIGGAAALPVGWALDRYGARPVMIVSLAAMMLSQFLRPFMDELWQFYALNALQFAGMPGAALITGARLVGIWFERTRGRAMGFTAMGANLGGIIFSSLTASLIAGIGWRGAYTTYGLLFAILIPVVFLVVRERPPAPRAAGDTTTPVALPGVTLRAALRSRAFYLVVLALLFAQVTYQSILPQLVPHLENVGISRTQAAAAISAFAFFGMGGKVFFGWFCERFPARYALVTSLACQIAGIAILLTAGSAWWVWAFVPVFGLGFGALGVIMPLLVQETFGMLAFGTIFGMVNFLTLGAALVGPALVGISFDATGSYQLAFTTIAGLFVLAAAIVSFVRPVTSRPVDEHITSEAAS